MKQRNKRGRLAAVPTTGCVYVSHQMLA